MPWAIVGFIFQYVIRRRHFAWWAKYNYVLSAALDSGVALSVIFIFFTYVSSRPCGPNDELTSTPSLQYPKNGTIGENSVLAWWGNNVYAETADWKGTPLLPLPEKGYFGPDTW